MKKDLPQFEQEQSPQDSLDWLAFRYVAGELDQDDRLSFEDRLADDQQAREAVASAVELAEFSFSAFESSDEHFVSLESQVSSRWHKLKPVLVLAGAIGLLIAGGVLLFQGDSNNGGDLAADSDSVAVAWAEIVADEADLDEVELNEVDFETDLVDLEDAGWMLVALSDLDEIEGGSRE